MSGADKRIFRFGVFEADASSGELRKAGMRVRVQEKPFQVLVLLLERPGEVVTREELRQKLWPSDTFVDFDHSLNTIINKIREALDDSAANPRFIETLAKRGYRFLVPVEYPSHQSDHISDHIRDHPVEQLVVTTSPKEAPWRSTFQLTDPSELPVASHRYVRALFLLIQIMYLSFYITALARLPAVEDLLDRVFQHPWATIVLILSAGIGIPVRLYLFSAVAFDIRDLSIKFLRLFPAILVLDAIWALSPFLLAPQIGVGLALGVTAALIYVPFGQRTLVLMRKRTGEARQGEK
jgi:DNA-binding winged helix-turn-helix (wHTH) protein